MVNFDELETALDLQGGMPVAYGVRFRDVNPYHTWEYARADDGSVHMYVFVDRNNLPVGMSLVHPPTARVAYQSGTCKEPNFKALVLDLFGYLSQLAAYSKDRAKLALLEREVRNTLAKATANARQLENVELNKAA